MPKLRPSVVDLENRAIIANIYHGMKMADINPSELALAMRTSLKTVYTRFKHPETFRVAELRAVGKKLHVPWEQLITSRSA